MGWLDGPFVGFDTETTGVDPTKVRPVSYAFVLQAPEQPVRVDTSLCNPLMPIPPASTKIHGITDEMVKEAPTLPVAVNYCIEKLKRLSGEGLPIVGMNLAYDLTMLNTLAKELGLPDLEDWEGPCLDIFVLDKAIWQFRKGKRRLTNLVEEHGVTLPGEAHGAVWDATASCLVLRAMAAKSKRISFQTPSTLHTQQIHWRMEQQQSLSKYLVDTGKRAIDEREMGWPIYHS